MLLLMKGRVEKKKEEEDNLGKNTKSKPGKRDDSFYLPFLKGPKVSERKACFLPAMRRKSGRGV